MRRSIRASRSVRSSKNPSEIDGMDVVRVGFAPGDVPEVDHGHAHGELGVDLHHDVHVPRLKQRRFEQIGDVAGIVERTAGSALLVFLRPPSVIEGDQVVGALAHAGPDAGDRLHAWLGGEGLRRRIHVDQDKRTATAIDDVGGVRVDERIEIRGRRRLGRAEPPGAHDVQFLDLGQDARILDDRHGDVGEWAERHHDDRIVRRREQRLDDEIHRVLALERVAWLGPLDAVEAGIAVRVGPGARRHDHRSRAAREDADVVGLGEIADQPGVALRPMQLDIAVHRRHAENLQLLLRRKGHEKRDRVVLARIAIDDDGLRFHARLFDEDQERYLASSRSMSLAARLMRGATSAPPWMSRKARRSRSSYSRQPGVLGRGTAVLASSY